MKVKKRFHAKEFLLLALPALLFTVWAWHLNEQNVPQHITGKWRSKQGNILEMRVIGNELIVIKNGREDKNFKFRFVSDNHIEVTDMTRPKTLVYVMEVRLRRGQLQVGRDANNNASLFERITP